jgi:hypothetical protein
MKPGLFLKSEAGVHFRHRPLGIHAEASSGNSRKTSPQDLNISKFLCFRARRHRFDPLNHLTRTGRSSKQEQAFFNQKGFTTDATGDVDASAELERTRKEGKIREAEHSRRHGG